MKSRLALLAVPFLALACTDAEQATLLEPPAISADVTIEAQPQVGSFDVAVSSPGNCGTAAASGSLGSGFFILAATSPVYCIDLLTSLGGVHIGGSVTFQYCRSSSGARPPVGKAACAAKLGRYVTFTKVSNTTGTTRAITDNMFQNSGTYGWRIIYRGQGSGVKNRTVGPFDVVNPA